MRTAVLSAIVIVLFVAMACDDDPARVLPSSSRWVLPSDSSSIAVFVFDYETGAFEGGALNHFAPCAACDSDSLPLDLTYRSPGDFGSIAFTYTATGDTVFYATIIWMGKGKILSPDNFLEPEDFRDHYLIWELPDAVIDYNPQHLDRVGNVYYRVFFRALSLDLARQFELGPYVMGIYIYGPSVGLFDPSVAKYIVFLYRTP